MKRVFEHEELDIGYDDLVADTRETGRVYVAPDGSRYPSVTTVLGILSEDSIREWRQRVGEEEANKVSHRASNRGTAVHSIIEKYLRNEDTSDNLPHIKQSLANLRPIFDKVRTLFYSLKRHVIKRVVLNVFAWSSHHDN